MRLSLGSEKIINPLEKEDKMPLGDTIFKRLEKATDDELREMCKIFDIPFNSEKSYLIYRISKEYRAAAGHSFLNIFRDEHEFPYKQILIDVADKLKKGLSWTDYTIGDTSTEIEVEEYILRMC